MEGREPEPQKDTDKNGPRKNTEEHGMMFLRTGAQALMQK